MPVRSAAKAKSARPKTPGRAIDWRARRVPHARLSRARRRRGDDESQPNDRAARAPRALSVLGARSRRGADDPRIDARPPARRRRARTTDRDLCCCRSGCRSRTHSAVRSGEPAASAMAATSASSATCLTRNGAGRAADVRRRRIAVHARRPAGRSRSCTTATSSATRRIAARSPSRLAAKRRSRRTASGRR